MQNATIYNPELGALRHYLNAIAPLPESIWQDLCQVVTTQTFAKGCCLQAPNEEIRHLYFIVTGLVKFYYLTSDGTERITSFGAEKAFAGPLTFALGYIEEGFYIETIEATKVIQIPTDFLFEQFQKSHYWAYAGLIFFQSVAQRKARREVSFLENHPQSRYEDFLKEYAYLAERLKDYHIASYLGITNVSLSRIKQRIKEQAK